MNTTIRTLVLELPVRRLAVHAIGYLLTLPATVPLFCALTLASVRMLWVNPGHWLRLLWHAWVYDMGATDRLALVAGAVCVGRFIEVTVAWCLFEASVRETRRTAVTDGERAGEVWPPAPRREGEI